MGNPFIQFVIVVLGIDCLAYFIREPDVSGPWDIVHWLRHAIGIRYDDYSNMYGLNPIAQGLTCAICGPIWIGIVVTPLFLYWPLWTAVPLLPLAISRLIYYLERN